MKYSNWRNASKPLTLMGIPIYALLLFIIWGFYPTEAFLIFILILIVFFGVIARFGVTGTIFFQKIHYGIRGKRLTGRPWWYRKFFN